MILNSRKIPFFIDICGIKKNEMKLKITLQNGKVYKCYQMNFLNSYAYATLVDGITKRFDLGELKSILPIA